MEAGNAASIIFVRFVKLSGLIAKRKASLNGGIGTTFSPALECVTCPPMRRRLPMARAMLIRMA
ncbi:hypothetical protein AA15669_1633 [Saccharibacter floricola DSM 15669]|uniref:Uncharacterized protein n=1 Tax=Saccharibacter floricola DSM 15669 TaxID=1123227 RepID=A0ABQ0P0N8_9PROT|nr:hypothetical protein AA15669_1633 [Saccharibacter floricola DSM 15669]